ncbi:MAG: hypothetical protein Q4E57_09645 [Eubacteriales bacterium]|nr:hypothetical protein [Eubacteriales bacterium]MDO4962088.1 hypothetical protein [Eubacteriales bacterium]
MDALKPYDLSDEEWDAIEDKVISLANGDIEEIKDVKGPGCSFDLMCIKDENDWPLYILAESEHFIIRRDNEDAALYLKPYSKYMTSVGDFYGEPQDAYIDPQERFCITVGCGIIKYNLSEPFYDYMYDMDVSQWIENGRGPENIEWCDHIEEVTDSYIVVSAEGTDIRKFDLMTLEKI